MIDRLSQRDRIALAVGAVAVGFALIWFGIYLPYRRAMNGLDSKIASRQRQLSEVQDLRNRYLALQQQLGQAQRRLDQGEDFALFAFVEDLAGRYASKENLTNMRPQPATSRGEYREESVEVRLERIRLAQLIQLLYAIDNAQAYVKVKNLRIKPRFDDKTQIDAVMTVASYRRGA